MSGTRYSPLAALAAAPVRPRAYDVMPETLIPQGVPTAQNQSAEFPLDPISDSPLLRQAGVTQGEEQRMLNDAVTAAGFSGGIGTRYVRRSLSPDTPFNPGSPGLAMFVETRAPRRTLDALGHYGPEAWISSGQRATDVRELQPAILRALRQAGEHEERGTTAAALARDANPVDIVNSAGLWDDPRLVRQVWDDVLGPRGVTAVRTNDGLVIFDPSHARPIKAP